MRIQLQLDDDLVDVYKAHMGRRTLEKLLVDQLTRFQEFGPTDVGLVLRPQTLGALAAILGPGATVDAESLLAAVRRQAQLQVGKIDVPVTPSQWERVQARAEKQGRPIEQVCTDAAERILAEIAGF